MDIITQLIRDEGKKNFPYADTVGKLTIGVGRNLIDVGLSDSEVGTLLQNDVAKVTTQVYNKFPWYANLDLVRQGVILNMAFNMGTHGLEGFPLFLRAMAQGDWNTAAGEMLDSLWAKQVGDRAIRLAQQIKTGEWV